MSTLAGVVLVSTLVARDSASVTRRPFVEPSVSEPSDALAATRVFAGQLGQVILGGGSSGTAIDDGDYGDPAGLDEVDPCYDACGGTL